MKYLELIQKLQQENPEHIILVKNGIFFVAIGKDALELNKTIGLKLTCMRPELCKVGFQTKSLEKYIIKIKETKNCNDCSNCMKKAETEEEIIERVRRLGATT